MPRTGRTVVLRRSTPSTESRSRQSRSQVAAVVGRSSPPYWSCGVVREGVVKVLWEGGADGSRNSEPEEEEEEEEEAGGGRRTRLAATERGASEDGDGNTRSSTAAGDPQKTHYYS